MLVKVLASTQQRKVDTSPMHVKTRRKRNGA